MRTLFTILLLIVAGLLYMAATEEPPEPKVPADWLQPATPRPARYQHR